jgi:hypothetical protein
LLKFRLIFQGYANDSLASKCSFHNLISTINFDVHFEAVIYRCSSFSPYLLNDLHHQECPQYSITITVGNQLPETGRIIWIPASINDNVQHKLAEKNR